MRRGLLHILPFLEQGGGADCFRSQALVHVLLTLGQHLSKRGCAHGGESLALSLQGGNGICGVAEQFIHQLLGICCHHSVTALFGRIRIGDNPLAVAVFVKSVEPELGGGHHGLQSLHQEVIVHGVLKMLPQVIGEPCIGFLVVVAPVSHTSEYIVLGEGGPFRTVGSGTAHGCAVLAA